MDFTINSITIKEITKWINEKSDVDTINDVFGGDIQSVTEKDVIEYIYNVVEGNLEYDFDYNFGLE